jgi:hypothetical protein
VLVSAIADCFTDWFPAYAGMTWLGWFGMTRRWCRLLPTFFNWIPDRVRKDVVLLVPPPRPSPALQGREINEFSALCMGMEMGDVLLLGFGWCRLLATALLTGFRIEYGMTGTGRD